VNGWAEILQRLGDRSAGIAPTLFIHRRCARLIETLPALQHDPNRPEDVLKVDADEDGVGGDDAADCLRYLVATKAREIIVRKLRGCDQGKGQRPPPTWTVERTRTPKLSPGVERRSGPAVRLHRLVDALIMA